MKGKAWYIKFPQDAYALGPVRFSELKCEAEVRQWARAWEGVKRLPNGFSCWKADNQEYDYGTL